MDKHDWFYWQDLDEGWQKQLEEEREQEEDFDALQKLIDQINATLGGQRDA